MADKITVFPARGGEVTMSDQFSHGYALLIAVDQNQVEKWALPAASLDLSALRGVLVHPQRCAYPPEQVKVVQAEQATRAGILKGLKWLREKLEADTSGNATAVVYFSGHGGRSASGTCRR